MIETNPCLSLEVVYNDEHLIQVECRVSIRGWSGIARAYTTQDDLRSFASNLLQFGEAVNHLVTWEIGADNGIGLIALRFYTIDRAGHVRCHARLASNSQRSSPEGIWRFEAEMPTEPQPIINFARHLAHIANDLEGCAILAGLPD